MQRLLLPPVPPHCWSHAHRPSPTTLTRPAPFRCFYALEAPPVRVCGWDTPFPLVYEPLYLPTAPRLADAIRRSLRA